MLNEGPARFTDRAAHDIHGRFALRLDELVGGDERDLFARIGEGVLQTLQKHDHNRSGHYDEPRVGAATGGRGHEEDCPNDHQAHWGDQSDLQPRHVLQEETAHAHEEHRAHALPKGDGGHELGVVNRVGEVQLDVVLPYGFEEAHHQTVARGHDDHVDDKRFFDQSLKGVLVLWLLLLVLMVRIGHDAGGFDVSMQEQRDRGDHQIGNAKGADVRVPILRSPIGAGSLRHHAGDDQRDVRDEPHQGINALRLVDFGVHVGQGPEEHRDDDGSVNGRENVVERDDPVGEQRVRTLDCQCFSQGIDAYPHDRRNQHHAEIHNSIAGVKIHSAKHLLIDAHHHDRNGEVDPGLHEGNVFRTAVQHEHHVLHVARDRVDEQISEEDSSQGAVLAKVGNRFRRLSVRVYSHDGRARIRSRRSESTMSTRNAVRKPERGNRTGTSHPMVLIESLDHTFKYILVAIFTSYRNKWDYERVLRATESTLQQRRVSHLERELRRDRAVGASGVFHEI